MTRWIHSLQTKLTLSFMFLILSVAMLSILYTYGETKKALKETMRDELMALAGAVASQIDGDTLGALKAGDETTPQFQRIHQQLVAIKNSHPDIKYAYTMRRDGGKMRFIVDADYGTEEGAGIDEEYKAEEPDPQLSEGFNRVSANYEFQTDKWGSFLSGFAPLKDSKGKSVGVVGIDMTSNRVVQKQNFLRATVYYIMLAGISLAGLFILIFSKTIIRDIHKLINTAEAISMGDMNVTMDVNRRDEIGQLAQSFGRMAASLKIMMMPEEPANNKQE